MKKLKESLGARVAAWVLLPVLLLLTGGGALLTGATSSVGLYARSLTEVWQEREEQQLQEAADRFYQQYCDLYVQEATDKAQYELEYARLQNEYAAENSNLLIKLSVDDKVRWENDSAEPETLQNWFRFTYAEPVETKYQREVARCLMVTGAVDMTQLMENFGSDCLFELKEVGTDLCLYVHLPVEGSVVVLQCSVMISLRPELSADDSYAQSWRVLSLFDQLKYVFPALTAVFALLAVLLTVFLLCAAGHRKGQEGIVRSWLDKIPLELSAAGTLAILYLLYAVAQSVYSGLSDWACVALLAGLALAAFLPLLALLLSFATRVKAGAWWRNTVCYWLAEKLLRLCRKAGGGVAYLFRRLPLIWKTALLLFGVLLMNVLLVLLLLAADGKALLLLFFAAEAVAGSALLLFCAAGLRELQKGGEELMEGRTQPTIDRRFLFGDFRRFADTLGRVGSGIEKAVEDRMRSERLKTELITNVSHDIKTPLTSLINYVDLLKKEKIETQPAAEYIDVLERQSAKLKKLTDDLLEASKASTGNITVHFQCTALGVLMTQLSGEYAERLAAQRLELLQKRPEEDITVLADGNLLWRVMDNLMGNICKYSLAGTRVYMNLEKVGSRAVLSFRNISRSALNVGENELMERFVRGDPSRTTEGSGLGLSIAKSLTELQNGTFRINIDGDLFKAVLTFPVFTGTAAAGTAAAGTAVAGTAVAGTAVAGTAETGTPQRPQQD